MPSPRKRKRRGQRRPGQRPPTGRERLRLPARQAAPRTGRGEVESRAAERAIVHRGAGAPLRQDVRSRLERGLERDLSHVRVHDDAAARGAAESLGARAFTHRHHIWLGSRQAAGDVRLMAHEAAHVVQQAGHAAPPVQRAPKDDEEKGDKTTYEKNGSSIDTETKKVTVKQLKVPSVKASRMNYAPIKLRKSSGDSQGASSSGGDSRGTEQRKKWDDAVKSGADAHITTKLQDVEPIKIRGKNNYYLKTRGGGGVDVVGERGQIKDRARRPSWDKSGKQHAFDVDHIQEWQLSGPDEPGNYWLWDASANRSSGSNIANEINRTLSKFLGEAKDELGANTPTLEEVKSDYESVFSKVVRGLSVSGSPRKFWELGEITGGRHANLLRRMNGKEIEAVRGSETELSIYTSATGGQRFSVPWAKGQTSADGDFPFYDNFVAKSVTYTPGGGGSISGVAFKGNRFIEEESISATLSPKSGVDYGGYINGASVESQIRNLKFKQLSPIEIHSVSLESGPGLVVRGKVLPSVPLIKDAGIDLTVTGHDVTLSKTFSAGDFDFPGPIQVTDASLTVGVGGKGLLVDGAVLFEITNMGRGEIKGSGKSSGAFALAGTFDFDAELFEKAQVKITYEAGKLGGEGDLVIAPGKLRGIKSAKINVKVEDKDWKASGEVEPEIPAVESGSLEASYKEGAGLEIGGKLDFSSQAPAIKGGSITVNVVKGDAGYKVKGSGSAKLDIPGIDSSVDASYDDGAFDASARVAYKKGLLDGSLKAGVKKPTPDAKLIPYGHGTVGLKIAPWLKASVGIRILENQEIEVKGKVSLPDALELFPQKKVEKELLSIGVDIPIVGVSVAGQRVGIFANITGAIGARASIGPGQLDQLSLEVFYNPNDESATKVTGKARFVVPADAGLSLSVRGSLGAGIPVVSAQLGLDVTGELGVEGKAKAGVEVSWTPTQGIDLEAEGEIKAKPKFKISLSGFALVQADILVKTIELYRKNWELAKAEVGSNLEFGIVFPVHYREGEPFSISLSDVKFIEPKMDATGLMRQVIDKVV